MGGKVNTVMTILSENYLPVESQSDHHYETPCGLQDQTMYYCIPPTQSLHSAQVTQSQAPQPTMTNQFVHQPNTSASKGQEASHQSNSYNYPYDHQQNIHNGSSRQPHEPFSGLTMTANKEEGLYAAPVSHQIGDYDDSTAGW